MSCNTDLLAVNSSFFSFWIKSSFHLNVGSGLCSFFFFFSFSLLKCYSYCLLVCFWWEVCCTFFFVPLYLICLFSSFFPFPLISSSIFLLCFLIISLWCIWVYIYMAYVYRYIWHMYTGVYIWFIFVLLFFSSLVGSFSCLGFSRSL